MFTAYDLYGSDPTRQQPTPTGTPDHRPGTPAPSIRTEPRAVTSRWGLNQPILVLVAMIGLAVLLLQVSIRGEVELGA